MAHIDVGGIALKGYPSRGRLLHLYRLLADYVYVQYRKARPSNKGHWRFRYLPMLVTPFSLLRSCRSDISVALHRMGQRVDSLPNPYMHLFGSSEVGANGSWMPDTRTLACMRDMQNFEKRFPKATEFDWEMFQIGWEAGAKWAASNSDNPKQE
ncbi:MAG TPA: hypothetical protein VGC07_05955 [Granulicella sp.]